MVQVRIKRRSTLRNISNVTGAQQQGNEVRIADFTPVPPTSGLPNPARQTVPSPPATGWPSRFAKAKVAWVAPRAATDGSAAQLLAFRAEAIKREEIQRKRMVQYWAERFDPSDRFNIKAATKIQAFYRSYCSRKKQVKIILAEIRKMQGKTAKPKNAKPRRNTKRQRVLAATKIQAAERRRQDRVKFAALKQSLKKWNTKDAKRSLQLSHDVPKTEQHLHRLRVDFATVLAHELGIVQSQVRIMSIESDSNSATGESSGIIEFVLLDVVHGGCSLFDADDQTAANTDSLTAETNGTLASGCSTAASVLRLPRAIVDSEEALQRFDEKAGRGDLLLAMADVGDPKRYKQPGKRCCCLKPNKIAPLVSETDGHIAPQPRKHVYTVVPIGYAVVCSAAGLLLMAAVSSGMGAARTMAWLQAALLSLVINILIVQPMQVVAMASFIQYAEGTENQVLIALASAVSNMGKE